MKFSLVLPTYGEDKLEYLENFLEGLLVQTYSNFELIVVDQNETDAVAKLCKRYDSKINLSYLHSEVKGLSLCRNLGLRHASGEIIAFPDDDCLYPNDLLMQINKKFQETNFDLISVNCLEYNSKKKLTFISLNETKEFGIADIFKAVSSISVFFKGVKDHHRFDEQLGLGGEYFSSEEFDFTLSFLRDNKRAIYIDDIFVLHPDNEDIEKRTLLKKVKRNSIGHGAFLRKHFGLMPLAVISHVWIRPFAGIIVYFCTFKFTKMKVSYFSLISRTRGFFNYRRNEPVR
ncbi:MAG: glycosyltransferase family 2 protein [bacterium]|nr:glycosyltransferase family 2 protein [bacterium]